MKKDHEKRTMLLYGLEVPVGVKLVTGVLVSPAARSLPQLHLMGRPWTSWPCNCTIAIAAASWLSSLTNAKPLSLWILISETYPILWNSGMRSCWVAKLGRFPTYTVVLCGGACASTCSYMPDVPGMARGGTCGAAAGGGSPIGLYGRPGCILVGVPIERGIPPKPIGEAIPPMLGMLGIPGIPPPIPPVF